MYQYGVKYVKTLVSPSSQGVCKISKSFNEGIEDIRNTKVQNIDNSRDLFIKEPAGDAPSFLITLET